MWLYHYRSYRTAERGGYSAGLFSRNADHVCADTNNRQAKRPPSQPLTFPLKRTPASGRKRGERGLIRCRVCVKEAVDFETLRAHGVDRCWRIHSGRSRRAEWYCASLAPVRRHGSWRGEVLVSRDGGVSLRAPSEPPHGVLSTGYHRGTPHARA